VLNAAFSTYQEFKWNILIIAQKIMFNFEQMKKSDEKKSYWW